MMPIVIQKVTNCYANTCKAIMFYYNYQNLSLNEWLMFLFLLSPGIRYLKVTDGNSMGRLASACWHW
jgi:hypothetical protein